MPKEEWGTKRLCPHCSTRFYDLNNNPMACPACGNQFTLESLNDGRGKTLVAEKNSSKNSGNLDGDDDIDNDSGDLDDDLLDDDDDDGDVSLDEIADVSNEDED
ncbi:TIGR02300 family protein [Paracoccus sp. Z330]|uniref:TIGR02300 family protein n=1 Tax=Paracoccus onchidii TaxID=3017813 RepID=A0ABT4ZHH2_9RHOB|nr:TIGR02300 family protein [Paracoccus onchidii]MDB6178811.1 TIGR02300 family protein [Paracoccus onchidii]